VLFQLAVSVIKPTKAMVGAATAAAVAAVVAMAALWAVWVQTQEPVKVLAVAAVAVKGQVLCHQRLNCETLAALERKTLESIF